MSLFERLAKVAKNELGEAARRIETSAKQLIEDVRAEPEPAVEPESADPELSEAEMEAIREQVRREEAERYARGGGPTPRASTFGAGPTSEAEARIGRFYANLELPVGASAAEVKAAYRRLMRRYHPDKHVNDPHAAQVAHELTHRLRTAYDGLMAHLEGRHADAG